jgi:hypothetical protein
MKAAVADLPDQVFSFAQKDRIESPDRDAMFIETDLI